MCCKFSIQVCLNIEQDGKTHALTLENCCQLLLYVNVRRVLCKVHWHLH